MVRVCLEGKERSHNDSTKRYKLSILLDHRGPRVSVQERLRDDRSNECRCVEEGGKDAC